jgi:Reverse transcriptase (RNA-dependent DNA polymerase)/RNase H-like domain found in reverse transcriptase
VLRATAHHVMLPDACYLPANCLLTAWPATPVPPFKLKKVVLSKKKALNVPITFSSTQGSKVGRALIDSGATENFVDKRTARRWELPTHDLVYPRKVFNVDGTENRNGMIVKSCMLRVRCGGKQARQRFYIMNLGDDHILLGYPWLEEFNPDIDWKAGAMKGLQIELEVTSLAWQNWRQGQATIKIAQMEPEWEAGNELIICKTHFAQDWAIAERARKGKDKAVTVEDQGIPNEYKRHSKVFSKEGAKRFLPARPEDHAIKLVPDALGTINCKTYPLMHAEIQATKEFIKENIGLGYIEKTDSPWSSPWFFIKKKDGSLRPVQDYREVNKWTVRDVYPIPHIEQILEVLHGKELFTALDIQWGYNNIQIREEDQWKAAFKTPEGLFKPRVMFFGLMNSPATFQRTMDRVFLKLRNKYPGMVFVYMDDILIATSMDCALHHKIVHQVLELLEEESFFLKPSKCKFKQTTIDYLGIVVSKGTVRIDPTKQNGIAAWPRRLTSVKQVRSTLGVLGYQRPFIPGFTHLARPITQLLKKEKKFKWTDECTEALDKLIKIVSSDLVLQQPNYKKLFTLEVDASQYATGAILYQENDEGKLHPVGYHSHTLNPAERGYDVHDRELLVVMRGL